MNPNNFNYQQISLNTFQNFMFSNNKTFIILRRSKEHHENVERNMNSYM